ncbi:hypothetical protein Tco_1531691 [Tanacetum coccineum]
MSSFTSPYTNPHIRLIPDSEVEEMLVEANPYTNTKEASTSSNDVSNVYKIIEVIKLHWKSNVEGNHMFKVVSNLKSLKKPIRKLLHDQDAICLFMVSGVSPSDMDSLDEFTLTPAYFLRLFKMDCKVLVKKLRIGLVIEKTNLYTLLGIIYDIHELIHGFLWCNGEYKRGKAKVAWDFICLPKHEGGLGLRNLDVFNYALMTTHIWNIVSNKESLWLSRFFSHRDITNEGFHIQTKVADLISNGNWIWPQPWISKALILGQIVVSNIDGSRADVIQWKIF